jgi:N-acetylglucosamine malate deacetylase 2
MRIASFLYFLTAFLIATFFSCNQKRNQSKTILVVVAHPDDETGFGSALAKFSRIGYNVHLVIGVDGRYSTRSEYNNPDSLAIANKDQAICSCEKLGIAKPVFYGLISLDRKHGQNDGVRAAVESGIQLREELKDTILEIKPDLIITYGADGEYGHPEHIIVSSIVTELLMREKWVDKYPLYYFGWTRTLEQGNDGWIRYADDQYFNVIVSYTDEDEHKSMESLNCYERMHINERIEIIEIERKRKNELYFRKFIVAEGLKKDFFGNE